MPRPPDGGIAAALPGQAGCTDTLETGHAENDLGQVADGNPRSDDGFGDAARGFGFERIVMIRRERKFGVGVQILVALRRRKRAVNRLVREIKYERFLVRLFDEVERMFVENVGHVAIHFGDVAVHVDVRVRVDALPFETDPVIEARAR